MAAASHFVPLRIFSAYTMLEGAIDPKAIAGHARRLGFPAAAITDRNGLYGTMAFGEAAKKAGVQPIVGALLGVARPGGAEGKAPTIDDESWHLIKETPKVMGFIGGTADRPLPIKDSEADAILQRVQEGVEKPRPKVLFEMGEAVRVKEGPFTDFHGNVEDVNYEKSKLRVSVTIFGRSTPMELDFSQVEKA